MDGPGEIIKNVLATNGSPLTYSLDSKSKQFLGFVRLGKGEQDLGVHDPCQDLHPLELPLPILLNTPILP